VVSAFCSAWKLVRPSDSITTTSPSIHAVSAGSLAAHRSTAAKFPVQSLPLREIIAASPASMRQTMR
jgi:hypothetical protein